MPVEREGGSEGRKREGEGRLTGRERGRKARVWPVVGLQRVSGFTVTISYDIISNSLWKATSLVVYLDELCI